MKRFAILFVGCALLAGPALGTSDFNRQWKATYTSADDLDPDFKTAARKAGCYVCHVKGKKKEEARNEYGTAVNKFLKAEDFPKEYIKDNPEEAAKKIVEGLKKAGEMKSKDGKTFAAKIKNNELPATDAGLE